MSAASLAAGLAGLLGVLGCWEALAAVEQAMPARVARTLLSPLRAAGREGRSPTTAERRRIGVLGSVGLLAAGWLVAGPAVGAASAALGPWAVAAVVRARRRRWRAELARGAPTTARAMADALGAGHAVRSALATAAEGGVAGPAARELRAAATALALGERTDAVLERLRRRDADPAWDTIVAAILLQRRSGGDLAAQLRRIAGAQEEAARLQGEARGATAQARFTARLVVLLPAAAAALAELASPGYLRAILAAPLAAAALAVAAACQLAALLLIRRVARVEGR